MRAGLLKTVIAAHAAVTVALIHALLRTRRENARLRKVAAMLPPQRMTTAIPLTRQPRIH